MLTLLQPTSSQDCDSNDEAAESTKRRISFTPDLPKGEQKPTASLCMIYNIKFALCYCSLGYCSLGEQSIYSMWNTVSVIPLATVDCRSAGENKEVVRDMGRKRESNSCLRRSSEALVPSSPGAAVLDTNLVVRDNLERRASFEGNLAPRSTPA